MLDFNIPDLETEMNDTQLSNLESMANDYVINGDFEAAGNAFSDVIEAYGVEAYSDSYMAGTEIDELENFNPLESDDIYDAGEAMEVWEFQGDTNRCAQFSQMFVIEEFTGMDLDPNSFCELSEMNGWFDENGGTTMENMNKMLDLFDINNEMSQNNSFEDLLNCLENDGRAIVALDSGEYWNGEGFWSDIFSPNGADHAVEVIGYNPDTECVILNDSGSPNGCGEEIPLDTFMDAWEDSDNLMIECYR